MDERRREKWDLDKPLTFDEVKQIVENGYLARRAGNYRDLEVMVKMLAASHELLRAETATA